MNNGVTTKFTTTAAKETQSKIWSKTQVMVVASYTELNCFS